MYQFHVINQATGGIVARFARKADALAYTNAIQWGAFNFWIKRVRCM